MKKSKLLQVFYALAATDKTNIKKWLHSPAYNHREDVIQLWEYMMLYPKIGQINKMERKKVFVALFPKNKFDMQQLRYIMSFLIDIIEKYLIAQQLEQTQNKNIILSKAYQEIALPQYAQQELQKAKKLHKKQNLQTIESLQEAYTLEWQSYQIAHQKGREDPQNLQELSEKLDAQFIATKLKQGCRIISHETVYKKNYNKGMLSLVLEYVATHIELLEKPAIALYYYYYRAVTEQTEKEDFFAKFKELLLESYQYFSATEARDLYTLAINYGIKRTNTLKTEFYIRETLELYQFGLDNGFLIQNQRLSQFTFINMIALAMRLDEYEWTKIFIENYQQYLDKKIRATYVHYGLSRWHFEQKHYSEAMERLQQVEYEDLLLNLSAKVMLLKIYYEIEEYELLESFLNSFKTFLSRKKMLAYHKENYSNIIKITQKLIYLNPHSKKEKEKILTEIKHTKTLTEREWLLKQLYIFK